MSARLATWTELSRDLSTEDAYDLTEIILVDSINKRIAEEYFKDS